MNLKLQDLGRVAFLRKNSSPGRVVEVKAKHFNRLKFFSTVAIIITIISTGTVIKLTSQSKEQVEENNKLQSQIASLQTEINSQISNVDSLNNAKLKNDSKAVGYIESIQEKLTTINNYLRKRGLSGISFRKINTDKPQNQAKDDKLYSDYDNYLSRLVSDVSLIPMGYPKISSLTSFFGYRSNPFDGGNNEFHPGIDFKGHVGDEVKCTASGRVVFTGREGGYGNCIHIKHTNNLETWYGHLSRISVHEGEHVTVGDVIGRVGSTGRSTGPHLHYEVRKNGHPVNPIQYLSLNR